MGEVVPHGPHRAEETVDSTALSWDIACIMRECGREQVMSKSRQTVVSKEARGEGRGFFVKRPKWSQEQDGFGGIGAPHNSVYSRYCHGPDLVKGLRRRFLAYPGTSGEDSLSP